MQVKLPMSSLETGLINKLPLGKMTLLPPDPIVRPSFFQLNLGRGAASGLQTMVTFPRSAA